MRKQIELLLKLEVIVSSQSTSYSQVLVVPKTDPEPDPGTYRFCLDYRNLNTHIKSFGWRVPVIKELLQRLGYKRNGYFGVIDLTSGYHQAAIAPECRKHTAFITFMGIYEWARVPMGLKSSGSYFQEMMAAIVLIGLVYIICEVYMDDVLIHGKDPKDFMNNLRQVFERFRKHKITVNPRKCILGLTEVTFVGHRINKDGPHSLKNEYKEY